MLPPTIAVIGAGRAVSVRRRRERTLGWVITIVVLVIAIIVAILFLNRFYKKATREVALVRTGAGGQKVILDGGCFALPILHKVSEVNMKTTQLEIARVGEKSMITSDRLRVDAAAEFYVRVNPTPEGVATAAQALGGKSFRAAELAETLEGKLVDAMLSVAAGYTMDTLQDQRGKYAAEVSAALHENLAQNGLDLESVSITRLDQTSFDALDENNAFNAVGMRRLAEIIATNQKERAAITADAEVSVRQSQLDATKKRLVIEREEQEAQITQQRDIEERRAESQAEVAEKQAESEERRERATEVAVAEGRLAATAILDQRGQRPMNTRVWARAPRQRRAADALLRAFPVLPGLHELAADDTIVCRCEDVTRGQVREAAALYGKSARAIKMGCRAGMGPCQARICGPNLQACVPEDPARDVVAMDEPVVQMPVKPVRAQTILDAPEG